MKKGAKENKSEEATNKKVRTLVVDEHPATVRGICEIIKGDPELEVCGTAGTAEEAIHKAEDLQPDLIICEITFSGSSSGLDLVKNIRIRYPKMWSLFFSMKEEELYALRCLRAGADGYISKKVPEDEFMRAIQMIVRGEIYVSENIDLKMRRIFSSAHGRTGSPLEDLSDRELEVFGLVGRGKGRREIAEELHLSVSTIATHFESIKEKLNLLSAKELLVYAIQWHG